MRVARGLSLAAAVTGACAFVPSPRVPAPPASAAASLSRFGATASSFVGGVRARPATTCLQCSSRSSTSSSSSSSLLRRDRRQDRRVTHPLCARKNRSEAAKVVAMAAQDGSSSSSSSEDSPNGLQKVPWSAGLRKTLGALAGIGALETGFLSYQKLANPEGLSGLCGVGGGCSNVLNGPYSNILGIPLTLPAVLAYGAVALLAVVPLFTSPSEAGNEVQGAVEEGVDSWTRSAILMLSTAMAVFSSYLMLLLAVKLHEFCPWCVTSAALSYSLAAISWSKQAVPGKTQAAVMGLCTTLITAMSAFAIFFITEVTMDIQSAGATLGPGGGVTSGTELVMAPEVTTNSSKQAIRLAKHLDKLGARMYGAYWCSHCYDQKMAFGKQAYSKYIDYVECSKQGFNSRVPLCREAKVPGYPTWEINGALYPGEKDLGELEEISGLSPYKP